MPRRRYVTSTVPSEVDAAAGATTHTSSHTANVTHPNVAERIKASLANAAHSTEDKLRTLLEHAQSFSIHSKPNTNIPASTHLASTSSSSSSSSSSASSSTAPRFNYPDHNDNVSSTTVSTSNQLWQQIIDQRKHLPHHASATASPALSSLSTYAFHSVEPYTAEWTYLQFTHDMPQLTVAGLRELTKGLLLHIESNVLPNHSFFVLSISFIQHLISAIQLEFSSPNVASSSILPSLLSLYATVFVSLIPTMLQASQFELSLFLRHIPCSFDEFDRELEANKQKDQDSCMSFDLDAKDEYPSSSSDDDDDDTGLDEEFLADKSDDEHVLAVKALLMNDEEEYTTSTWNELQSKVGELYRFWQPEWFIHSSKPAHSQSTAPDLDGKKAVHEEPKSVWEENDLTQAVVQILTLSASHPHFFIEPCADEKSVIASTSSMLSLATLRQFFASILATAMLKRPSLVTSLLTVYFIDALELPIFGACSKLETHSHEGSHKLSPNELVASNLLAELCSNALKWRFPSSASPANTSSYITSSYSTSTSHYVWRVVSLLLPRISQQLSLLLLELNDLTDRLSHLATFNNAPDAVLKNLCGFPRHTMHSSSILPRACSILTFYICFNPCNTNQTPPFADPCSSIIPLHILDNILNLLQPFHDLDSSHPSSSAHEEIPNNKTVPSKINESTANSLRSVLTFLQVASANSPQACSVLLMSAQFLRFLQLAAFQSNSCFLIALSISLHLVGDNRFHKIASSASAPPNAPKKENSNVSSDNGRQKASKTKKTVVTSTVSDDIIDFDLPEVSDSCSIMALAANAGVLNYTDEAALELDSILIKRSKEIQRETTIIKEIIDLVSENENWKDTAKFSIRIFEDRRLLNVCQLMSDLQQISASPNFHYHLIPYLSIADKSTNNEKIRLPAPSIPNQSEATQNLHQSVNNTVSLLQTIRQMCTKALQDLKKLRVQFIQFAPIIDNEIPTASKEAEVESALEDLTESLDHKRGHAIYRFCTHGIITFTKILADCKQIFAIYTAGKSD